MKCGFLGAVFPPLSRASRLGISGAFAYFSRRKAGILLWDLKEKKIVGLCFSNAERGFYIGFTKTYTFAKC